MKLLQLPQLIVDWWRKRDERGWLAFETALADAAADRMQMGRVTSIRQRARSGTKAYMEWVGTGQINAVWAPDMRLSTGDILPVGGNLSYGPHHAELVFYIACVGPAVSRGVYRRWRRHRTRHDWQGTG